jgi:uncharacterized protein YdhG (YjbR/CyaY superfamily)
MTDTKKTAKSYDGFTAEERAAMKERARELKVSASQAEDEAAVLEKIASLSEPDRGIAERIHALVGDAAPDLAPKLWYGSPAYARDGKVVCFFQESTKFKIRYATLGFSDLANLDDGAIWPTAFALKPLTKADEAKITALVKQAAS